MEKKDDVVLQIHNSTISMSEFVGMLEGMPKKQEEVVDNG